MIAADSEIQMTIAQIEHGIIQKNRLLDEKNNEYVRLVEKRAEDEKNWRVAYHNALLNLTDEPVTVRIDLVKGNREVAKLKMKFEISLGIERACLESIKDIREKLAVYRSFLSYKKAENFQGGG